MCDTKNDQRLTSSLRNLYGRQNELKSLHSAFAKVQNQCEQKVQFVFVGGESGCGKSKLIQRAFADKKCLLGYGKFSERQDSKPLSVITAVIKGLLDGILHETNDKPKYRALLDDQQNFEAIAVIAKLVPEFSDLVSFKMKDSPDLFGKEGRDRLKNALHRLLCTLAIADCPIVICLDDLQWTCDISLDIIKTILTRSDLKHVLFVGCYRDNEINQNQAVAEWIKDISGNFSKQTIHMLLGKISVASINSLLSDLMNKDEPDTKDLATLIHSRTNGNIFHVLQMIDYVQSKGLIQRDLLTQQWKWDLNKIQEETKLSENAVQIVTANMKHLPEDTMMFLQLAACLGFRFSEDILKTIWYAWNNKEEIIDAKTCINCVIDQGMLERLDDDTLRFVHDKVFFAAVQMIECEGKRSQMHFIIGAIVWERYISKRTADAITRSKRAGKTYLDYTYHDRHHRSRKKKMKEDGIKGKTRKRSLLEGKKAYMFEAKFHGDCVDISGLNDKILFHCVDQLLLGKGLMCDLNVRFKFAKLCCETAKRAAAFSAFLPGVNYLKEALSMLQSHEEEEKHCWSLHYSLLLEIYSSMSEMLFAAGMVNEANEISDKVLPNANSIYDKLRVYLIKIAVMGIRSEYDKVVTLALSILDQLDEHFPKEPTKLQQTLHIQRAKSNLSKMSDDEILSLSQMIDKRKIAALRIMQAIYMAGYQNGNYRLVTILCCRMVELTLSHGLAMYSADGFALMSMVLNTDFNMDVDTGCRLAKLATLTMDKVNSRHREGVIMFYTCQCNQLRKPFTIVMDSLFTGYESGIKNGDLQIAFQNITFYLLTYFYSGLSLKPLLADMQSYINLMKEYGVDHFVKWNTPLHQSVLLLMGKITNSIDESQEDHPSLRIRIEKHIGSSSDTERSYTMQLAYYFGEMELARELSQQLQGARKGMGLYTSPFGQARVFFFCLIAVWHYKTTQKHKFKREAMRHLRVFRLWVKEGRINCVNKLQILKAEVQYMDQRAYNIERLQKVYNNAISASRRVGCLQDAALANYLAGIHFRLEDVHASDYYIDQACKTYMAWGADAIAGHIRSSFPEIFVASSTSLELGSEPPSLGFRSRPRFRRSLSERRKSMPNNLSTTCRLGSSESFAKITHQSNIIGY